MTENSAEMERAISTVERFATEGVKAMIRRLVNTTTARQGVAPGAPVDTGELRGSVRVTVGAPSVEEPRQRTFYPIPDDAAVDAALVGYTLGDIIWLTWIAEHAASIDAGRRVVGGRTYGSLQAPDGFVDLGIQESIAQMERWVFGEAA